MIVNKPYDPINASQQIKLEELISTNVVECSVFHSYLLERNLDENEFSG